MIFTLFDPPNGNSYWYSLFTERLAERYTNSYNWCQYPRSFKAFEYNSVICSLTFHFPFFYYSGFYLSSDHFSRKKIIKNFIKEKWQDKDKNFGIAFYQKIHWKCLWIHKNNKCFFCHLYTSSIKFLRNFLCIFLLN